MRKIKRLFEQGNVLVTGLRGTGKDMLMSNVCVRRQRPYLGNIEYDKKYHNKLKLTDFDVGNNCVDFIEGNITPYIYPFPDGVDIYISDGTVYFPNYDFKKLNARYPGFINYMALSRQIGANNVHVNCQNIERLWDKLAEQSDIYIRCKRCIYIKPLRLVIQRVRIYERLESFKNDIPPCPLRPLRMSRDNYALFKLSYQMAHGLVTPRLLIYRNRSSYDTRRFKSILAGGEMHEET